jgi:hypothetical protein
MEFRVMSKLKHSDVLLCLMSDNPLGGTWVYDTTYFTTVVQLF